MAVTELAEELRLTFLAKGCDVDRYLQPGLPRAQTLERTRHLGLEVPADVLELYEWRNGQSEDADMAPDALIFRDDKFVGLEAALAEYPLIQELYAPEPDSTPDEFDLRESFPIAAFMGSSLVVVCGEHSYRSPHSHPVVKVYQGLYLWFHSVEAMLRTCIAWVGHPSWRPAETMPEDIEHELWERYNPGIFDDR